MSDAITLYDLHASPNNLKIRLALGAKGLKYKRIDVDPTDRAAIVALSGQPLTPVLKHGDRVIFDSSAILRYIDANFREGAPLFHADRDKMKEIENWEMSFRTAGIEPIGVVFRQFFSESPDRSACAAASRKLNTFTATVEERLQQHEYLVGDRLSAADIIGAATISMGMVNEERENAHPQYAKAMAFFRTHLSLGEGRDKTREWVERILVFDRPS